MSTLPIGIRSLLPYPNVTHAGDSKAGELVAATPLGRDADGKNLIAYIVRTDDEAPAYKLPTGLANSNTPKKSFLSDAAAQSSAPTPPQVKTEKQPAPKSYAAPNTSAQFIKPDDLLTRLEQSQVNQLRARDADIHNDTTALHDGNGNALLTSLIYSTGPDGRRYAVGVSAPLLTQHDSPETENISDDASSETPVNTPLGKAAATYQQSSYFNATDFRSALLDKAI
ncbi:MAG: hypothetical protein EB059_10175 [Alphaproteobacteria bacterium]|nr:hypothetical protein [Alphaproteobacteria bacterium]